MYKNLRSSINQSVKRIPVPATILDVLGNKCSVILSDRGVILRGRRYSGRKPQKGDKVYVDYSSGSPIIITSDNSDYIQPSDYTDSPAVYAGISNSEHAPEPVPSKYGNMSYRGEWNVDTQYVVNNVVLHLGVFYICILLNNATEPPNASCWVTSDVIDWTSILDLRYPRKFERAAAPVVTDDSNVGYIVDDLWHDVANRAFYIAHSVTPGLADWYPLSGGASGGSSSGVSYIIDGALSTVSTDTFFVVAVSDMSIQSFVMSLSSLGTSGNTIVDIIRRRVGSADISIFDNGVYDNKPNIAWNDVDKLVFASPIETEFLIGDILILKIVSVALGASGLFLAAATAASGTLFNLTVEKIGGISVSNVGKITLDGLDLSNNGGGQVEITSISPDTPPTSPNAMNDEFNSVTLDAKWTLRGSGAWTMNNANGFLLFQQSAVNERIKGADQPISGLSWRFRTHCYMNSGALNFNGVGLYVRNSVNGKVDFYGMMHNSNFGYFAPVAWHFTDMDTHSISTNANLWFMSMHWYLEIEYNGTNFYFRHSADGYNYYTIFTYPQASWLAGTPTEVGVGVHHYGPALNASFSWFRRMA